MSDPSWTVRSNDGWQEVTVTHLVSFQHEKTTLIRARVVLRGRFWDRRKSLGGFDQGIDLADDFETALSQVILPRDSLVQLAGKLDSWLQDRREFQLALGEALKVILGTKEEIISSVDKPVFSLQYSTTRFQCATDLVVDDTCLEVLKGELEAALKGP